MKAVSDIYDIRQKKHQSIVMFVSVLNRSYECEYCYYSTNSEVYPYLHLYNKGKKGER